MPNIIINNYCNQACSYCFANANMHDKTLQKDMSLSIFITILKFLKKNNQKEVRILWGEPLLHKDIRLFLEIASKNNFFILLFSNINLPTKKLLEICQWIKNIRINCNINDFGFYQEKERLRVIKNKKALDRLWISSILSYNIIQTEKSPLFTEYLLENFAWHEFNIKITNSSIWENLMIDNTRRKLGIYIFSLIKKYHKKVKITISCWLDKTIFSEEEIQYINEETSIELLFGCEGNGGEIDINTDGTFFKCYPLQKETSSKETINDILSSNISLSSIITNFWKKYFSSGECIWNQRIKNSV